MSPAICTSSTGFNLPLTRLGMHHATHLLASMQFLHTCLSYINGKSLLIRIKEMSNYDDVGKPQQSERRMSCRLASK